MRIHYYISFLFIFSFSTFSFSQDLENISKQKPFELRGSLSFGGGYYSSTGFNSTRRPYSYSIIGAPVVSVYGIQIPMNITITEGSRQVNNPFAQFGINPYYKWLKVYAGWTNMHWSPTTLNGKTFLGGGIEINPGKFRFGMMYGRLNPAIKEDTLKPNSITPMYKRIGMGARIGVGTSNHFVDLILFKGKDISNSIPNPSDILNNGPQENVAIGIISKQNFLKKRLIWDFDGSISAYSRDINSETVDIGTGPGSKILKGLITPRLSTSYAFSIHSALSYRLKKGLIGAEYNHIEPEYQSMGVDYLLNDQEKYSLKQNFNLIKNKLNINLNEYYQHDDLNHRKAAKTMRTGLNTSINANMTSKFGISMAYNLFDIEQTNGIKHISDTVRLTQVNQQIQIAPRYNLFSETMTHSIFATWSYQNLKDKNSFTSSFNNSQNINTNIGYVIVINKHQLSISPMLSILNSQIGNIRINNITPTLNFSKAWLKNKLNTGIIFALTITNQNNGSKSSTFTNNVQISYLINKHHSIRFTNNIMNTNSVLLHTSEAKGELFYTYTF